MNIAVLMTVYNRKEKTLLCLDSLQKTVSAFTEKIHVVVYLTDDACSDGTSEAIINRNYNIEIKILPGTGHLFWNGGMINSWKAAIHDGNYDGYLWLNDDTVVLPEFWHDLLEADYFCYEQYGKHGIYVGSTKDSITGDFTYGGFNYVNKFTLLDEFVIPDGKSFQPCEAAHGNITFVSNEVVTHQGVFCDKYFHGGTDHDYTYLAHKAGFPVLVLPHYAANCENDHLKQKPTTTLISPKKKYRNELLFARRCFPFRYPLVLLAIAIKILFPRLHRRVYLKLRQPAGVN